MEVATAQRGEPSVYGRFARIRNPFRARPAWLTGDVRQISMKTFTAFLCLASIAFGNPALPERIAVSELKEESYFRSFGQYLQLEDGEFTREFGRVLILRSGDDFELAFYRKDDTIYVRVGHIIRFQGTTSPFVSAMNDLGVPCISARWKNGPGRLNAFVLKGKVETLATKE